MGRLLTFGIIGLCILSACRKDWNGRYAVTAFDKTFSGDTVSIYLRDKMIGRKFDILFDSTEAVVLSAETHRQFKLPRWRDAAVITYIDKFQWDNCYYTIVLKKDTGLVMRIELAIPRNTIFPVPVQNSAGEMLGTHFSYAGSVECILSKVKE